MSCWACSNWRDWRTVTAPPCRVGRSAGWTWRWGSCTRLEAILLGRALKELVPLLAQAMIVIVVTVPFGLKLHVLPMLLGLMLLLVFGVGVAALSYALAIASKHDGSLFYLVSHSISLPLMLLGGVLLPMEMAPRWLYIASRFNPLAYLVEAERALFTGELFTFTVLQGIVVAAAVGTVGLAVGSATIKRASL